MCGMSGGGTLVGRRRFHAFLSHAHVDSAIAAHLAVWLRDVVKVPVWYDADQLPPGARIASALSGAIEQSRALILLLSKQAVTRNWVEQEYFAAINHQGYHPDFRIIPVRLDDTEPPGFLANYSNIPLLGDGLDGPAAAAILRGLYQPGGPVDPENGRNVYFCRGWRPDDEALACGLARDLVNAGLQLVGDAEDQPSWLEGRVCEIMSECGAFAAALPYRADESCLTSKYVLREWQLAVDAGLPCLVVADGRTELSDEVRCRPGLLVLDADPTADASRRVDACMALADRWAAPTCSPYVFYATDFASDSRERRRVVKDLVEAVTTLPCQLSDYVGGGTVVQQEILRQVAGAKLVLADISEESPNVYVEIGAARSAGVAVALLRSGPPRRPAFMLRDQQVWDYADDADMFGRVVHVCHPYRRSMHIPSI